MDFYEVLLEFLEHLKECLSIVLFFSISFSLIFFAFRIFKSLTGPFGRFDAFSGFLGPESDESENKEEIHVSESSDLEDFIKQHRLCDKETLYKINLSKDKSGE